MRSVESGVQEAALLTTVQPARSAGMTCQAAISIGQFHGVIEPTTPTGRRSSAAASSWMVSTGIDRPAVTRAQVAVPPASTLAPMPFCESAGRDPSGMMFDQIADLHQLGHALAVGRGRPSNT